MIRTIIAAFAAILLVACGGTPDTTDLDATFETYLPWDAERSDVETGMGGPNGWCLSATSFPGREVPF